MSDDLIERVTGVIAKAQHLPPESITIDSTFEELKIDSLDGINLLFVLEGEFDVDIPDDAARQIRSVRDVVEGIEKLLVAKAALPPAAPPSTPTPTPTPTPVEPA
jgi:acyl carrier protein